MNNEQNEVHNENIFQDDLANLEQLGTFSNEYLQSLEKIYKAIDIERQYNEIEKLRSHYQYLMRKELIIEKVDSELVVKFEILINEELKCEQYLSLPDIKANLEKKEYLEERLRKINSMIAIFANFLSLSLEDLKDKKLLLGNLQLWAMGTKIREKIHNLDKNFPTTLNNCEELGKSLTK